MSFNPDLEEINIKGCVNLKKESVNLANTKLVFVDPLVQISEAGNEVRNILIVGLTGSGKSSLASTLSEEVRNTNNFKSAEGTTSVTKIYEKSKPFSWKFNEEDKEEYKYCVIDNIGLGDTGGKDFVEQILYRIGEGIKKVDGELNQILFTFKGRFDSCQIEMFNLFKEFINESEITKFVTIVVTNFKNYSNTKKREEDKEELLAGNKDIRELIKSCNDVIYINNPGFDKDGNDEEENKLWHRHRKRSREIVLNHLAKNCNRIYKLKEWDSIKKQVSDCLKRIDESKDPKENTIKNSLGSLSKYFRVGQVNVEGSVGVNFGIVRADLKITASDIGVIHREKLKESKNITTQYQAQIQHKNDK